MSDTVPVMTNTTTAPKFQHDTIVVSRDNRRSAQVLTAAQATAQGLLLNEGEFAVNLRTWDDPLFSICELDGGTIQKWGTTMLRVTMHTVGTTVVEEGDSFSIWGTKGERFGAAGASWLVRADRLV